MNAQHYDLIAIGGGSGGLAVAETAARLGRKTALVDPGPLGGACVNRGCVPKKLMWYAAQLAHAVDDAPAAGIPVERGETDWATLSAARDARIGDINRYWDAHLAGRGIAHIRGDAAFVDPHTVAVDGLHYAAPHIVIATGSEPVVPRVPGAHLGLTSDDFFRLRAQPRRVAVVGGGYIGVELAGVLNALGSTVTLFAMEARLLERFDAMLGEHLARVMRGQGVRVHTGFQVGALGESPRGLVVRSVEGAACAGFDAVIWAVGRRPRTAGLNLAAAGLEPADGAVLAVDDWQNTAVPGLYAVGDVTGRAPLTPVAIAAGRRLAERLFGGRPGRRVDYDSIPSVVFSHPPAASVGLAEGEARRRYGDALSVYRSEFTPLRYALAKQPLPTAMKLVCAGPQERVVGVHIIGEGADEMLQGFAVALRMGASKADLDDTIAIHPTSAEELVTMRPAAADREDAGAAWREAS